MQAPRKLHLRTGMWLILLYVLGLVVGLIVMHWMPERIHPHTERFRPAENSERPGYGAGGGYFASSATTTEHGAAR
ncbi:MAG: hypothetical protein SFX73_39955 [Kofleriaceae bacterium]|nr:hypothetical protein [Kofleriaceae bacterium]